MFQLLDHFRTDWGQTSIRIRQDDLQSSGIMAKKSDRANC